MHEAARKRIERSYRDHGAVRLSRAVLLVHLQVVLIALAALCVAVVIAYTEKRGKAFYLPLTSLSLLAVAAAARLNFAGRYSLALAITVAAMHVGPWSSIVYERIVHSGDLIPIIYVILPTQVCALLLSGRAMTALGIFQFALFAATVVTEPARDDYNWVSLVCFALFALALGTVTSHVIRRQYDKTVRMKEALEKSDQRLTELSLHDALTGLFNRRHMEDVLAALIDGENARFGVAILDVDDYKTVNDRFGHGCGDEIIRKIADTLVGALAPGEVAFRYGGDEFLITLAGGDVAAVQARGEAVRRAIEEARYACLGADQVPITASVGVSFFPLCGSDRDAVLRAADRALYAAKRTGKNRVVTCVTLDEASCQTGA